ncbi:MAG: amidohydrolase [Synergistaceae bacterium]|nr:amidohydrolase [Synergistaceae bacterium]
MFTKCKDMQAELVNMRRDLHKIPELGLNLPLTQKYVVAKLNEYGIEYSLNEGDSGVIAYVNKGKPGKVIALRADMDALPITEANDVEYKSTHEGKMHACGHDAHTSMLLGAAKILNENKDSLNGEVRFIFQTAEELSKGAPVMLNNNAMKGVNAVFGTHIGTIIDRTIPSGTFIVCPGAVMASFDRFVVTVKGKGCHGSTPEKGVDPINIAAHVVLGLEGIIAREFNANDPVVITVGKIQGGSQYNIIPDEVIIEGTTRAFTEENRQKMARRIEEVAKYSAEAFGGTAELFMDWGAAPVVNAPEMSEFAGKCAIEVLGEDKVITKVKAPNMGGEDFAFYLKEVPGAFMFLSSANPDKKTDYPHHNPHFNIDEDVLWEGSAIFVKIASEFLK